jgi:hypothetical protein
MKNKSGKSSKVVRGRKAKASIGCSVVKCGRKAATVCSACGSAICKRHTNRIKVGPPGWDKLVLEICGSCAIANNLLSKSAAR